MISQSQFMYKDITHITIAETDDDGAAICSGCKKSIVINKAYCQSKWEDKIVKHFSVHKYCSVQEQEYEKIRPTQAEEEA